MVELFLFSLALFVLFVLLFALILVAFLIFHPVFGGKTNAKGRQKLSLSNQYNGSTFVNLEPTSLKIQKVEGESQMGIMEILFPHHESHRHPVQPLPTVKIYKNDLKNGDFVWLGHSTALFMTADKTILFDPVYHNGSPVPFFIKPFRMTSPPTLEELPELDAVLISHDHYDHLDYRAIQKIAAKVKHFYVPLGIKAHLQRWNIPDDTITELDWYEQATFDDITIVLTPSRHFSSRGVSDKNSTLWGSWVVKSPAVSVFFSGDSGYGKHFAEIGKRFGPFDIAFMENGQYNVRWEDIHMVPKQSVQAAQNLGVRYVLPIHWGKFELSLHTWKEPVEDFLAEADKNSLVTLTPQIGQIFTLKHPSTVQNQGKWWRDIQ